MRSYFLSLFVLFGMAISAYSKELSIARPIGPKLAVCKVDFTHPVLGPFWAKVTHDVGTDFDEASGECWKMTGYGSSFLTIDFKVMTVSKSSYTLSMKAASGQSYPNFAKISISVNGQMAVTGLQLIHSDFLFYNFDISKYMRNGDNEIQISLDLDTQSSFDIQSLMVN